MALKWLQCKTKDVLLGGDKKDPKKTLDEIKEREILGSLHSFFVHFFQFKAFFVSRVVSSFLFLSNDERRGVNRSFILVFDDAEDDDDECEEEEEEEERDDSIFSRLPRNVPPWRY